MTFNPARLTLARTRRGRKKTQLAEDVGVSARMVTAYERAEKEPSEATLALLAKSLRFPLSFFEADDIEPVPVDGASFRALSKMTASQRDAAVAAGTLCVALHGWISKRFDLPVPDVPTIDPAVRDPETAAALVRGAWGLGTQPVGNLVHLLELHGVRIFSLAEECRELDAFSFWHNDATPFICLNTMKTAEHSRFDAAHELGHLILHRGHSAPRGRDEERQADAFASAFLVPESDLRSHYPRFPGLDDLAIAKKRWGVSVAALNYRMHKVGLISDWHYRELCIELSIFGRSKEPNPQQREQSQVLAKVFAALRKDGVARGDVAAALDLYVADLDELIFGLVVTALEGDGAASKTPTGERPTLRLV